MTSLGLNDYHQNGIAQYLRFCRQQRTHRLRSIDACFHDVKNTRLVEDTYAVDEVEELVDGLADVVRAEVEVELLHASHTNSLLLANMFSQSQKWHLNLNTDTASLENKEQLEELRLFDEASNSSSSPLKLNKLSPMATTPTTTTTMDGPEQLLHSKINELTEENERIKSLFDHVQSKLTESVRDKVCLNEDLINVQQKMGKLEVVVQNRPTSNDVTELSDEVEKMRLELSAKSEAQEKQTESFTTDLSSTQMNLRQVKSQLALAEKELEKKFSQTGAYQNMKKMLNQKNDKIKILHRKLCQYEPDPETDDIEEEGEIQTS